MQETRLPDVSPMLSRFYQDGWVQIPAFINPQLNQALLADMQQQALQHAGVGRQQDHLRHINIRRDQTAWLTGETAAQQQYLQLMAQLQTVFNQHFFLGLFDFECHYARYGNGDFYQKHVDAFKGRSNRVLTTVSYLNSVQAGGELLLYNEQDTLLARILPTAGSIVIFESERFPHEVLPALDTRFSIAGWFRRNTSINGVIDPGS